MNMHLDWSKAESDVASTIGWYRHLIISNSLSTEAALYLTNSVLTPKLEYRLRFFKADKTRIAEWDKRLKKTLNNTYNHRIDTQKQAIAIITEHIALIAHFQKTLAEPEKSDAGYTTRLRIEDHIYPLWFKDLQLNRNRELRNITQKTLHIKLKPTPQNPLPKHWERIADNPEPHETIKATLQGETYELPTSWYGTWGGDLPQKEITVYTDGSRKATKDNTTASWAAVRHVRGTLAKTR